MSTYYNSSVALTDKKKRILEVALTLFANEGYNAVSTSMIAKHAEVSEALIFRHFGNKKGLLDALNDEVKAKLQDAAVPVLQEENPKATLQKLIHLTFEVDESEYDFWRLQFKLKWEKEYYNPEKMQPIKDKLKWAFHSLGYKEPETEAKFLMQFLDSVFIGILQEGKAAQLRFKDYLIDKYGL